MASSFETTLFPIVQTINEYLSNYVLVILLLGVGIWYTIKTRCVQVRCFKEGWTRVFGNITLNGKKGGTGMSSFQALATAIAAQVGTGIIVGVAGAILTGGPGAVFWMWVISFFGMATIYAEATLAQETRIVELDSGRSYKVLGLLRAGRVDIAFASAPGDADDLEHIPCFETHSCFVAAPDYPCDFTRAYTTEEIAAFPLILLEKKASSRTYLEKYFLQSGVRLTPEIELGARSLLVDLAKIGFGVAGVTREFVQGELAAGEIRELSTAFSIPPRTVDLCMLRNVSPSAATERFARDVLEKLQGKSVSV